MSTTTTTTAGTIHGAQPVEKFDDVARSITTDYRILDTEQRDRHDRTDEWATLRVTTWHDKDRRAFVSRVSRVLANDRGGYRAKFNLMDCTEDPAPTVIEKTPRYNVRALSALHRDYIAAHLSTPEQITAALTWAREAVNQ